VEASDLDAANERNQGPSALELSGHSSQEKGLGLVSLGK
jgi:hypothetical protein